MLLPILLLPLAAYAAVLQERQGGTKLAGIDKLEPQYRKTAQRTLTKFGPYTLKGSTSGGAAGAMSMGDSTLSGQSFFLGIKNGFCNDKGPCTILAGKTGVMFADGTPATPAQGIYIHHILSSDTAKKQSPWLSACGAPNRAGSSISSITGGTGFIGVGEDNADGTVVYTSPDGTLDAGYHINKNDPFNAWAQVVNYNKEAKNVYVFWDLEWIPGLHGDDLKNMLISTTGCGGAMAIKTSSSGPTNTTSGKYYFMENGKITRARGHLHDGGVQMDLFINDKFLCSSKAVYGTRDPESGGHSHGESSGANSNIKTISSMTTCQGPFNVKKGDALTMVAEYDLKKHPLRKSAGGSEAGGVMGLWGITFAADK